MALLAAACGASADTPAALSGWAAGAGYRSSLRLLRTDVEEIATGISKGALAATRTACDGLGSDAATAIGQLPTPDHALTRELNAYYSGLVNAAQACSEARALDSPAMARYRRRVAAAQEQLQAATRRYRVLSGR